MLSLRSSVTSGWIADRGGVALPERCRQVMMLRHIDGLAYKEIAPGWASRRRQ